MALAAEAFRNRVQTGPSSTESPTAGQQHLCSFLVERVLCFGGWRVGVFLAFWKPVFLVWARMHRRGPRQLKTLVAAILAIPLLLFICCLSLCHPAVSTRTWLPTSFPYPLPSLQLITNTYNLHLFTTGYLGVSLFSSSASPEPCPSLAF